MVQHVLSALLNYCGESRLVRDSNSQANSNRCLFVLLVSIANTHMHSELLKLREYLTIRNRI